MYKFTVFLKSGEAACITADKCESDEGELVLFDVFGMDAEREMIALFAAGAWSHLTCEKVAK